MEQPAAAEEVWEVEPAVVAEVAEDTSQEDNKIGGHEATYFHVKTLSR